MPAGMPLRSVAGMASHPRAQLLTTTPVTERRLDLAGVETPVLEGGEGPAVVLLHGPGGNAAHWARVIPGLVASHRVIAPDLPGQGDSEVVHGTLDADHVLAWLGELIEHTCPAPPSLVGYALGGGIAARFAIARGETVDRLVLVDALGLTEFAPEPGFGQALHDFLGRPTPETHEALWRQCAADLDALRPRMDWEAFEAYNLERARTPTVQVALGSLMEVFGVPAIPGHVLERIRVPTTLVWGRHDRATALSGAEAASARFGWPLEVIEDCGDDPPVEAPEAFVRTLRTALGAVAQPAS
jgi:pimeloyl-ACP methyl ester carboxylesterase